MDQELIAMCNCPEIQDRWEPKVGDMYIVHMNGSLQVVTYPLLEHERQYWGCRIYIPRIEDVLEWETVGGLRSQARAMEAITDYIKKHELWDLPVLQTALVYHMERKHGKSWDTKEKAWVQ